MQLSFAVDLITFFHPAFWGLDPLQDVRAFGQADLKPFWGRMLDEIVDTGVEGLELTFSPFGWEDTVGAFGSAENFAAELDRRKLRLATGFFADIAIGGDILSEDVQARHVARAAAYADYLAGLGADIMVMGLPMRASWDADPPRFVDLRYAEAVAGFCNRLGAEILRRGVRLALHVEAHSVFSTARDVDLFMVLTDPMYVSFCPDLAHLTLSGADPVAVVRRHKERMIVAHWKDATGPAPLRVPIDEMIHAQHRPYFCALGAGRVDWAEWMRLLGEMNFEGWAVVEIDAAPEPSAEIKRSMDFVRDKLLKRSQ